MNLKDFLNSRDKPPELYWSLVIENHWVQAGIWYIGEKKAEVISVSPGAAWETEDELTGACDAALSSSVQKLPEDYTEPSKTVFGVASSWVKDGEIQEEFLARIKKICTDLSLTPVGFVVLPEAIAHLYKSEEGAPLSAVVIGLGQEALEITVFKLGNLVGTTQVSKSVSILEDVIEGLTRFEGAAPLPSRIIIYDGKGGELEEAKDSLLSASWDEGHTKFLHTPKVETLASDKKVIATSLAGAAEIGNVTTVSSNEEEQILPSAEVVENVSKPAEDVNPESLGFAVGEDVSAKTPVASASFTPLPVHDVLPEKKTGDYVQKTKSLFHKFSKIFSIKPVINAPVMRKTPLTLIASIVIFLLIAGGLSWWFFPKATVTIFVSPKKFEQDVNLSFSTDGKFDPAAGILPGQILTAKESGDKTKSTTGTKLIGNNAKGTVQISNGNPNPIHLSAGTILTSSSGLRFLTDTEASVSGQLLPGSPGTATMNVTSADIGAQYNLAKGEIFSVGNFSKSLVAATSQADFSGGSSQEISAVSRDDQTNLETDLKNELATKAQDDLSSKASADTIFVNNLAGTDITSENFDHKVGDSADNLKLSLSINVTAIAADRAKLLEYAKGILQDKVPAGYVLRDTQIDFQFTFVQKTDGVYNYKVAISANFLPEVSTDTIISKIAGKTVTVTQDYLNSIPGFVRAEVKLSPNLPSFLATLPHVRKNITIDVMAEQ